MNNSEVQVECRSVAAAPGSNGLTITSGFQTSFSNPLLELY